MAAEFDTIIIGAGSAGCVLAGRLGEDASQDASSCSKPAALDNHWMIRLPIGVAKVWNEPRFNWSYESEPEPFVDNRRIYHPRGKVVGGSSSINMMAYVRGNHRDFDRWRQKGLDGLVLCRRAALFQTRRDAGRTAAAFIAATAGRCARKKAARRIRSTPRCVEAAPGLGYTLNDDFNGASQDGITRGQYTASHGRRYSAARAYLHPAIKRGNVALETRAHVTATDLRGQARRRRRIYARRQSPRGAGARGDSRPAARSIRRNCCCCRASVRPRSWRRSASHRASIFPASARIPGPSRDPSGLRAQVAVAYSDATPPRSPDAQRAAGGFLRHRLRRDAAERHDRFRQKRARAGHSRSPALRQQRGHDRA